MERSIDTPYQIVNFEVVHPLSLAEVVELTTTNFRCYGQNLRAERWAGLEDSLALSATLGLMELHDRNLDETPLMEFGKLANEVCEEVQKAKMVHYSVDIPRREDRSTWLYPIAGVIERIVTDQRGFGEVGRVRVDDIEDSLTLEERLGWMTLNRAEVIYLSTARRWSRRNILATSVPFNVDTTPSEERKPILVITERGLDDYWNDAVEGNLFVHFGILTRGHDRKIPVYWDHEFVAQHEQEIMDSIGEELPVDLIHSKRTALLFHY